ncbi:transcription-associated protein 1 [Coemansia sp. RSA 376]|nr:transcription-associated protein 1 [Coemansia sp. RSA 376]
MGITNFEVYATRLRDERLDVKLKQTIAHELCESLEAFQPQDYSRFVSILWPVIRDILLKTPPVFVSSAPEQKLRSTILEIIQRIPHSEVFRPIVLEVVTTLLSLVKIENEDNAVVCLKIIYELHRMYRQLLESVAGPFLELAAEIYRNADQMLKAMDSMDTPAPHPTPNVSLMSPSAMSPGPDVGDTSNKNLGRATTSFKVMTEIPIIVVSVIQANRRHADPFVTGILPLILHMLELNPRSSAASYDSASQHWRSAYVDLITAQSKTLSFLAFFARGFTALLLPCQARIAQLTLQLLCSCPAEATATRKEMLIATRHIVSTEIRKAFVPIADKFLDMQVLVGSGLASQCILRPFAFSMLADLMHHIRSDLSPSQLSRMVDFYAGCMHDQQLSSGVHTMCAKLLHNITECIMHIPSKQQGRVLLLAILKTFISSFSTIGDQAVAAIADIKSGGIYAEEKLYGANELIRTNAFEQGDKIKELRFLLRSLVTGCKNVIYALRKCDSVLAVGMGPRPPPIARPEAGTAAAGAQSIVADHEAELAGFELELLTSLFREGLRACRIHDVERQIEQFANLFVNLDPAVFHELFTSQFDYAFRAMIDHCAAISSVQVFVAFDATSPAFISIMLRYMCDRLELLGSDDEALTGTMLHLFKIAFLALAFFPEANEPVLQPYIQPIINSALTISKSAKKPENYFLLLRALFRSIGGGRYESLYKEVFPVLQNLLETLNGALGFTKRASPMQELFVEICLTVPVRLSVLLPYLSLLMKPLVFALESGPELVSQGLRTLELCIDNLTREFLDPILTPVMDEIMSSLWVHLRLPSSASSQAPVAARILGKLGGRNRHMLLTRFPSETDGHASAGDGCFSVPLTFEGLPGLVSMPLGDAIAFSITVLEDHAPAKQLELARKDAVEFVVACARYMLVLPFVGELPSRRDQTAVADCGQRLVDLTSDPLLLKRLANIASPRYQGGLALERIILASPSIGDSFKGSPGAPNSDASLFAATSATSMGSTSLSEVYASFYSPGKAMPISHSGLMQVLWALSLACSDSDLARNLLRTIISLGAQQHISQCVDMVNPDPSGLDRDQLCPTALAIAVPDAISRALVSHSDRLRSTGCLMLRFFYTALRDLLPDKESLVGQLPAMRSIVSDLCAACYDPNIETKLSGCKGVTFLIQDLHLGRAWLADNLLELSKALLFTLKDTHLNVIQSAEPAHSRETLLEIIRQAFPAAMFAPTEADVAERMAAADIDEGDDDHEGATGDTPRDIASSERADVMATSGLPAADSVVVDSVAVNNDMDTTADNDLHGAKSLGDDTGSSALDSSADAMMIDGGAAEQATGVEATEGSAPVLPVDGVAAAAAAADASANSDDVLLVDPDSAIAGSDSIAADVVDEQLLTDSIVKSNADTPTDAALDCVDVVISSAASDGAASPSVVRPPSISASTTQSMAAFQRLTARLSPDNGRLINSFLALITKELANPSTEVRDATKACLDILVGVTGCSVTALLLPSRDRLLVPIFGKPLRALPHNMQIGNIDAITYCLSLDPPFLEINEELLRLLSEALALADAEDQALVNHPAQVRSNTVSLTHLRHVCIRMLTAAMVRPEFADAKNTHTRARIISVFFKSLYHKSVEVVDAANDGLKQVLLQQQKLPRDLLQTGLRPILMNLSDYKRLTVASLDGLARLLQLLTNYFKVEVGRKLLDHMQQWANPQLLQAALEKSIEDMHEIKILVAILKVFHLLPSSASVLLDDLVSSVVNLEVHLCRRESSPFRKPLFKFLNRYPAESAVYFIERIESTHFARIFAHAVSCPESGPLREALVNQTPMLIDLLNSFSEQPSADTAMPVDEEKADPAEQARDSGDLVYKRLYIAMSVVALIHTCMEYTPLWLEERSDLLSALLEAWSAANSLTVITDQVSRLAKPVLIEHLVRSLLLATRAMSNPPSILFKLLEISGHSSGAIDVSFIFQYVWTELITKWSIAKRREILSAFLLRLGDSSISDEANSTLLQHLINPMVATVFTLPSIAAHDSGVGDADVTASSHLSQEQRSAELLRGQVISLIHQRVWVLHMSSSAQAMAVTKASVRLELVQLSSILMRHAVSAVADLRKDIIKFGWIFIRNDDIMIKNASYVLVSQFIAAFDTPAKITLQAYSSLLKAHQVESRFLVRQALDILLPVLPLRLGQSAASTSSSADASGASNTGLPAWVVLAKRVLIDHSSSLALTTHVYQLIAGHAAIFFPYRMHFASNLVGILQKMCLTHSATSETRTLALDIMDLLLKWHEMLEPAGGAVGSGSAPIVASAISSTGEAVGDMPKDPSTCVVGGSGGPNATASDLLTEARRETIVGLLLRMLCLVFDFALKSNLGPRALDLLTRYLDTSKWPPMHLRLTFFERSVQQIESQGMNQQLVLHILTVLSAVTAQMQAVWFEEYYGTLVSIIRKCIVVDNGQVQKLVASMIRQLYEQAADNERLDNSPVVSELKTHTETLIGKNLQDGTNIFGTLLILDAVGEYTGEQFNSYTPHLMKLVLRCIKDHNSHAAAVSLGSPSNSAPTQPTLQSSSSSISVATMASDSASGSTPRAANSAADIISMVSANNHLPLTVDAIVKGETPLDILLMLLVLLRSNISRLGDQRRSFLTHIIQLIERSSDPALLHVVLAIVREWVLDTQDVFPTIKEKAMLMSSMMSFVHGSASANDNASRAGARASVAASATPARSASGSGDRPTGASGALGHVDPFALLERRYLTLVLEVYNDPRFTRSEMTMRLEQAFLSGMQSEDSEMRGRFLETFDANMPLSLPVRLNYLLETQNWESVSSTFWLQQCLPLLFASTHQRANLRSFVSSRLAGNAATAARLFVCDSDAAQPGADADASVDMDMDVDHEPRMGSNGHRASSLPRTDGNHNGDALDLGLSEPCSSAARADSPSMFSTSARAWNARTQVTVGDVVAPLARMVLLDTQFAYRTWTLLLPLLWQNLASKERHDLTSGLTRLLAKPYHQSQTSMRPNVIQAILDALSACVPPPRLPPQLLRYLGQTYGAWYSSLTLLEQKILDRREVESAIFDRAMGVELGAFDALSELYTSLSAHHYFYGAWKRHCQYKESHIALSYEQLGDWANAQGAYERAQAKARAGVLPFSESEYCLWESRWVETTKRLQNWDVLLELGFHESLPEIELEAGWRSWDWSERQAQVRQLIKASSSEFASSPRAKFYETYLALTKGGAERSKTADFQRMCKEGIKTCLQHWSELPPVGTPAHIGMLHMFQLMVELGDASNIYSSLSSTKVDNLESKSGDLKSVLQTWRERLPNPSDPINIWSDLIAWRQHVFKAINDVYVPFITQPSVAAGEESNGGGGLGADGLAKPGTKTKAGNKGSDTKGGRKANSNGPAADGGDAARPDSEAPKAATPSAGGGGGAAAANSVLTSYAYRGYHEMAWIINRFAHIARLHGLVDVCINSLTRIYTLPNIEIQEAFLKLREQAKCYYHRPQELQSGLDVISNTNLVYFTPTQKAEFFTLKGQFLAKLGKLEEANHAFATGIQLDLGSPKAWAAWGRYNDERFCSNMPDTTGAVNAISCYMQAAGLAKRPRVRRYLARTLWLLSQDDASGNVCAAFDSYKSEMPTWYWIAFIPQLLAGLDAPYSRQVQQILLRIAKQYPQALYYGLRTAREESQIARRRQTHGPSQAPAQALASSAPLNAATDTAASPTPGLSSGTAVPAIEELMPKLKTAHPLLALSMETMIDQIVHRLKPYPEEDTYRLVHGLLSDGLQQLHLHVSQGKFDLGLVDIIVANTCRVAVGLPSGAIKARFELDFGKVREMDLCEYVTKLYQWQQMLRQAIKRRPTKLMLSLFSPFLVEFEQQKFEDVEVPGQYLHLSDNNDDFVRIERFLPELSIVLRSNGVSRNLAIRGGDGSIVHFAVQNLTSRHHHQEERWVQLYRNLDAAGEQDCDTWEQHRLAFHLPTIVSLAPHIRLVQEQPNTFTLQDVYDSACARNGNTEIVPVLYFVSQMRTLISQLPSAEEANLVLFEQVCQRLVPASLLSDDVRLHAASPMDYWLYRENFSYQASVGIALTYMIASTQWTPAKLGISRTTGNICLSDLVPTQATPGLMHNMEPVPFRLTPNIQAFVTELGLEGIVPFAIYKVMSRFTEIEHLLRDFLDLYVRDELISIPTVKPLAAANPLALVEMCERNVKLIVHRAGQLAEMLPAKDVQEKDLSPMQPLVQLLSQAVAPSNLSKMDFGWMPWL